MDSCFKLVSKTVTFASVTALLSIFLIIYLVTSKNQSASSALIYFYISHSVANLILEPY